jgi:hypothetical protein
MFNSKIRSIFLNNIFEMITENQKETDCIQFDVPNGWKRIELNSSSNGDVFTDIIMDSFVKTQKYQPRVGEIHKAKSDGTCRFFFLNRMLESRDCCLVFKDNRISKPAVAIFSCFANKLEQLYVTKFVEVTIEPPSGIKLEKVTIPMWTVKQGKEIIVSNSSTVGARCMDISIEIDTSRVLFDPFTFEFFRGAGMAIIRDEKIPQLISAIACDSDKNTDVARFDRMKLQVKKFNEKNSNNRD